MSSDPFRHLRRLRKRVTIHSPPQRCEKRSITVPRTIATGLLALAPSGVRLAMVLNCLGLLLSNLLAILWWRTWPL